MAIGQIIAAVVLLAGNAFFVAVEFSVTRTRPTMARRLVRDGASGARSLAHAVDHIDTYLSACQLGITICSIGLGITAEPLLTQALEPVFGEGDLLGVAGATLAFVIAYGLVSMLHVVLGELAPKSLAISRTRRVGLLLLPPMRAFYIATKPVVDLFNWLGNLVLRPFGIPPASEAEGEVHTEEELQALIGESVRHGVLEPEEQQIAFGAFTFGDRRAREILVPRARVVTIAADEGPREAAVLAARTGHRRLVLVDREAGLDAALGVVHLTDVAGALAHGKDDEDLRGLARRLHETASETLLDDLLEDLRRERQRMALVRDEHATALGIVTLEDILEQVVGDLRDEFADDDGPGGERTATGVRIPGETAIRRLAGELEIDFGEHHEATLGGYVIERLGHVPYAGEELEIDGRRLRVLDVDGVRVERVELFDASAGEAGAATADGSNHRAPGGA